jgi:Reverse transcriptase (RNA-dependent DNA polymerase)
LTYDGAIITFESDLEMNGKPHSKQIKDYMNTVMFFGMRNSPATFQAMMDKIFEKEIKENLIIVYMDNILAFSKTIDDLKKIEWIILEKA